MIRNNLSRRKFLNFAKLSFLFLVSGCSNITNKIIFGFQMEFFPDFIKKSFPVNSIQKDINFSKINEEKNNLNYRKSNLILINDGWINNINFSDFKDISKNLYKKMDSRTKNYLDSFPSNKKNKLFPIGLVPYAVVVKNNKKLKLDKEKSWDFLLSDHLKGRIILPNSTRLIISLAKRIKTNDSLKKLVEQVNIYDDKNALDWILSKNEAIAIMPLTQCQKVIKIDSTISIFFPDYGVPLSWYFALVKNSVSEEILIEWISSLDNPIAVRKLIAQGWFLPLDSEFIQNSYLESEIIKRIKYPSKLCWENSWSFSPLNENAKRELEIYWNKSLTP